MFVVEKAAEPNRSTDRNDLTLASINHSEATREATDIKMSPVDENALLRKIDLHLIPWLALLYLLSFLDRSNVGNAWLYNLEADIHITDVQYLIALTSFFFPYSFFEMPSNLLLRKLRPSRWLAFLMTLWGISMTLHGIIRNYGGLITLRVLLGLFESGLYPGIAFYLTCWYKRSELGTRFALFFSAATVSSAFGGLLAAAIANLDGVGGQPAWAWIFIIEGLFTVLVGIASFWVIQDFPENAKFLSKDERVYVMHRLRSNHQFSVTGEHFHMKYVWQCLSDKKTWLGGFDATAANLLSVPVYAWACLITCLVGFLGDRIGQRGIINLVLLSIAFAGYTILIASRNPSLSYFACFLSASGIYPTVPNLVAWVSANTEGAYKRSAVLGLIIGWGNLNGAVTSNVYRARDKPWYSLGHGIILVYITIGLTCTLTLRLVLKHENAIRASGKRDEPIRDANGSGAVSQKIVYESIEAAMIDKGDEWSGFQYTL